MVEQQVRAWDVFDQKILRLLYTMPRDQFVDKRYVDLAYSDTEIPIGHGEKMMTPIIEGRLLQALNIEPQHSILEVGTGSGFLTACLARLGLEVSSIDIYDDLLQTAADRLNKAGIKNANFSRMDANVELPAGPFDAIAVTGSIPVFDERYLDALKPGGRLFVVVGEAPVMEALLVVRSDESTSDSSDLFETSVAPLVNSATPSHFHF
jgi:protein-L-isoaspartate(D-aspartate) O-methyltransferase